MTNINCSTSCRHENNGKCSLNLISVSSGLTGMESDCAYFEPRQRNRKNNSKSPQQ